MTALVVDASVAVKWFLPEIHADAADRLLKPSHKLLAPDLILTEVGNTVWKKVRRNEISTEEAGDLLKDLLRYPLQTYESRSLLKTAWEIVAMSHVSFYDGLYLTLALSHDCPLITADRKFYEAFRKSYPSKMVWIENI